MTLPAIPLRMMCLVAALAVMASAGCQPTYQTRYAPVPTHEAHFDEAMQLRHWPVTPAHYASGGVIAGPTNSNTQWRVGEEGDPTYARSRGLALVAEPLIALGNFVFLPISVVLEPPWERRLYEGEVIRPTYTGAVSPDEVVRETAAGRRRLARDAAAQQQMFRVEPGQRGLPDPPVQPGPTPGPEPVPDPAAPGAPGTPGAPTPGALETTPPADGGASTGGSGVGH